MVCFVVLKIQRMAIIISVRLVKKITERLTKIRYLKIRKLIEKKIERRTGYTQNITIELIGRSVTRGLVEEGQGNVKPYLSSFVTVR